jgi:hypothetical protein
MAGAVRLTTIRGRYCIPAVFIAKERMASRSLASSSTSTKRPKDGDQAEVRQKDRRQALILVFREHPVDRWESIDGRQVYDFQYFEYWRRA